MCWPHYCTDCTYDGTVPLNCPWNTRTKCDLTIHQYTFLNNSGIFTFTITATLKVHLKASIDFTVCPSVLWGEEKQHKKPLPENLPQCALHTQLHHPKPASLTQFPLVIIYSQTTCGFYQKALCTTHSPSMQAMIYFHASTAAEAWTLHCQWLPGHRRALCGLGGLSIHSHGPQHPHTDALPRALLPSWRQLLGKRNMCPAWFIGTIKEDWNTFSQLVLKWEV